MTESLPRLLDVNVLVALLFPQHVHHRLAVDYFDTLDSWATCSITEAGLVRLGLNPTVVGRRLTGAEVLGALAQLRTLPGHVQVDDDATLAMPEISLGRLASPNHVTDLHLVNLAAATGSVLATLDAHLTEFLEPRDRAHVELVPA